MARACVYQGATDGKGIALRILARHLLGAGLGLFLAQSALAQDQAMPGTVVELYTSQGCSSCPPADAFMLDLATAPGVIALALHVDYWDYLGWKDDFGHAQFSDRQRAYAAALGQNTIYTPQMIVGGLDQAVGSDPQRVVELIRRHQAAGSGAELQLLRQGERLQIRARAPGGLEVPVVVQLVRFRPHARVDIRHGENAGRTIDYVNIVTAWHRLGTWDGRAELSLAADAAGEDAIVVILQDEGPGRIRAAAVLR